MNTSLVKFCVLFVFLFILSFSSNADFHTYNSFDVRDAYFGVENRVPEYYRPRNINPLMAMLPEYSNVGPGFVCDKRQAPPVYRMPLQWARNTGYREADWFNNRMVGRNFSYMNFGGYDY